MLLHRLCQFSVVIVNRPSGIMRNFQLTCFASEWLFDSVAHREHASLWLSECRV